MDKNMQSGSIQPKSQAEDWAALVSFISEETHRAYDAISEQMPKVTGFVRKNWKPLAAATAVGLGAYGYIRARSRAGPMIRAKRRSQSKSRQTSVH